MKTADLIEKLVREGRTVHRMPNPMVLVVAAAGLSLPFALAGSALMGWRVDLGPRLADIRFWIVAGLQIAVCAAGEGLLAALAVPGRRRFPLGAKAGLALLAVLVGVLLSRTPWVEIFPWPRWLGFGLYCTARAVVVGLLPFLGGLWLMRRAACAFPRLSGATLGLVAASLGAFALHWSCDLSEPAHVALWHIFVPGALLGAGGGWAGSRWLRW